MSTHNARTSPFQGYTAPQALVSMRQFVGEETLNHFRMGLLVNYVKDSKLLEGTKYTSALDFFCENIQEVSRAALILYAAVAGAFSEEVSNRFGITRLKLLLTYKGAAKIELNYQEPGGTFIRVPDEQGEVKPKLFADCSVEDLRKALVHLRTPGTSQPISDEERALVDQYRDAVTKNFPQGTPIRVQLRNHQGQVLVDFKGIPVKQVDKLTEALLNQLYPVREVPEVEQAPQLA